jgi:peroxiredoxin
MKKLSVFFALAVMAASTLLLTSWMGSTDVTPTGDGVKVGDKAPDFNLKNIDGKMLGLKDLKKEKGVIVLFTCNHCPYAVMYEDRIIALHKKYAPLGYPVVAINPNDPELQPADSFEKMIERAKEKKFSFAYLFDEGQKVYPAYGATRTPHVFLLDKNRVVRYIGAIDDNAQDATAVKTKYLEDAIAALEAGKKPNPNFTKAVGCSIKAKKK